MKWQDRISIYPKHHPTGPAPVVYGPLRQLIEARSSHLTMLTF